MVRFHNAAIMSLKGAHNPRLEGSTMILNTSEILFTLINRDKCAEINYTKLGIKQ